MGFLDNAAGAFATNLGLGGIAARLLAATFFGLVIGLDREYREHPAGLRTHMLVSLAAATFTVLTFEVYERAGDKSDPIRIIEAVTAGVAFLSAGTIIQSRGNVRGLTTGAGLWLAGAIGLACGLGEYLIAGLVTLLGVIILVLMAGLSNAVSGHVSNEDRPPPEQAGKD